MSPASVLRLAGVRGSVLAWGSSVVADAVLLVALLVVAYDTGGPGLVALWSGARMLPTLVVAPLVVGRGDRGGRRRWLLGVLGARLALTHRPMHAALLPSLAATPAELTAANTASSLAEGIGTILGPALAGALLLLGPPALAVAMAAAVLAVGVAAAGTVPADPRTTTRRTSEIRDLRAGLGALARTPVLLTLLSAQAFAEGVLLVAIVVLAIDVLGLGDAAVGWLGAVLGTGGVTGALLLAWRARSTALARTYAVGVVLWGLPMVLVGLWPRPLTLIVAVVVIGVGAAVVDVGSFTLVARVVPAPLLGHALGAFAGVRVLASALGSWVLGLLLPALGTTGSLVLVGVVVAGLALLSARAAAATDRGLVRSEHLGVLSATPVLAPLPRLTLEHLSSVAVEHAYRDGEVVMREGEPGAAYHVVVDGRAVVTVHGRQVALLGRGEGFGEIALLRGVPRTATVSAAGPLRTVSLGREEFVPAVTGNLGAAAAAAVVADARLPAGTDES